MSEDKYNFYSPSSQQLTSHKIHQIMGVINSQEEYMNNILAKYKEFGSTPSQNIEEENEPTGIRKTYKKPKSNTRQKNKSLGYINPDKISEYGKNDAKKLKLPTIQTQKSQIKYDKSKIRRNKFSIDIDEKKFDVHSIYNPKQYEKAYIYKLDKERKRSRKIQEHLLMQEIIKKANKEQQQLQNSISSPIQSKIFLVQDNKSDTSEEAQIPLTYYERQYQQKLQKQCKQQLNFLYFSNNHEPQEWTAQFFKLLEEHDADLEATHKKNKFLQNFDQNYFTGQFYRSK